MNAATIVSVTASLILIAATLVGMLWKLSRIDFRVEEMWAVFKTQPLETPSRGRRRYDRTLNPSALAHDKPSKGKHD